MILWVDELSKYKIAFCSGLRGLSKISKDFTKEVTTRLSHIITSVDGNSERPRIRRFVNEELTSKDSLAFRRHIRETMPDIDTTFDFVCSYCSSESRFSIY